MEYCKGPTLMNYAKDGLPFEEAIDLFSQLLKAIKYLHQEKHVCHRDINPNNLIVTEQEGKKKLKLIDFNVATKFTQEQKMIQKTGFLEYRAPELVEGGEIGYN